MEKFRDPASTEQSNEECVREVKKKFVGAEKCQERFVIKNICKNERERL